MSYASGIAALNMQMTDRVPRTEYSVHEHWPLVAVVTGIDTTVKANRPAASRAFLKAWDYAFMWCTPGGYTIPVHTDMGHAVYVQGGTDYRKPGLCPFTDVEQVLRFDPAAVFPHESMDAMVARCNELHRASARQWPDCLTTGGIYHTVFSGLIEIFGWEMLLLAGGVDHAGLGRVIDSYGQWLLPYFQAWAKSDAPVIMCHDDICWTSGPVFAPAWYRRFVFPWYAKYWQPLKEAGKKLMFTSDGTYHMFFDDIVAAGADCLVMEPTSDMAMFAAKYGRTHGFVGNADTRVLLTGDKSDIHAEVKRCMDIGRRCPGFILAVGNHIPANTPVDNALYYNDAYLELSKR
ncbi:MAG: uroporphyrinogen decarboxylase family protein [Phycisphaerae bacterium]|nr:uroporphyrinogen decarboxylase family protein [Phycisphaerae bacterium]